ncbi:MAG: hypothetical protein EOO27_12980, partial [Comamonadaceae bacterium]
GPLTVAVSYDRQWKKPNQPRPSQAIIGAAYDFARLLTGATQVSCSGFGKVLIENMPAGAATA